MITKCPQCGFEPVSDKMVCPNCEFELKDNIAAKIKNDHHENLEHAKTTDKNDNINWSDYKDVSLGAMMEQLSERNQMQDVYGETSEEESEIKNAPEDSQEILAAYIRQHKPSKPNEKTDEIQPDVNDSPNESADTEQKEELKASEPSDLENLPEEAAKQESEITTDQTDQAQSSEEKKEQTEIEEEIADESNNDSKTVEKTDDFVSVEQTENQNLSTEPLAEPSDFIDISVSSKEMDQTTTAEGQIASDDSQRAELSTDDLQVSAEKNTDANDEKTSAKTIASDFSADSSEKNGPSEPVRKQKNKKGAYLLAAAAVAVIGGGWLYVDHQQKEAQQQALAAKNKKELADLSADLEQFYTDDSHQFLKADKTAADLQKVVNQLEDYKTSSDYQKLADEAEKISVKFETLTELNSFFEAPIIKADLLQDTHLKDNPITMEKPSENDAFAKLVNQAIEQGQKEYKQNEEVKNAVKSTLALYKENQLPSSVTRSGFKEIMAKVNALSNETLKKALADQMKPIDEALTVRDAAEQKKAEQAVQQAEQEQAEQKQIEQAQAADNSSSAVSQATSEASYILTPSSPTNQNNQPIIPARESDLADTGNPAWVWNPGVKEKIIATAIERGYVVEGGYFFEPVRIENGEGYYNFYATSNQSRLLNGISDSAFPMYLFTVNAKTGYFRGNGNDHTIR